MSSYQAASSLKPQEGYPKDKIAEINAALGELAAAQALDKQYSDAIASADAFLQAKDLEKAMSSYQAASSLKPQEGYPKGKIAEINAALGEIAAAQALDKQYSDAIASADAALQAKDYEKAMSSYQAASSLKPQEGYPKGKILEIETVVEEQKKQLELDRQYISIIAQADEYMKNSQYEEAKAYYQQAQVIKPAEQYPGKQVLQINNTLETIAKESDLAYQNAISKADLYFEQENYEMARLQYARALEIKPGESYPNGKLKQADDQITIKKQLVQQQYNLEITNADKFFTSKIYDDAIAAYRTASLLKPDEEYPKEMAKRILKLLSERSNVQLNQEPLLISSNTQHKFEFFPVPVKDRKSNYVFFKARNASDKEYKLIISFGKDQAKNGGVVVKVPAGHETYEYVVRISAQYKWFSDDNNWITFYPEGGDIEVALMQISYSD
jgi:tetratricopeptide (TPR) repeat protein